MNTGIPEALLRKHPELVAVGEALEQLGRGEPITAQCTACGLTLLAIVIEEVGALVIRCPDGHTSFRAMRARPVGRGSDS